MTPSAQTSAPGTWGAGRAARSQPFSRKPVPMADSLPPRPRKRPHQGSLQQQIEALERLAMENASDIAVVRAALIVMGIQPEPSGIAQPAFAHDLVDPAGFPSAGHPESLEGELPERDEEWLASVAATLWPGDEYGEMS